MAHAYVFVDESGNHSTSGCYTLAGTWCLTEYDDASEVLKPTRDRIANNVVHTDGELKGGRLSDTTLESSLFFARKVLGRDGSLVQTDAWGTGHPVAFTLYDGDSEVGSGVAERHLGEGRNVSTTVQLMALASVTVPILRLDDHVPVDIESHHVVLDGTTWRRAGDRLEEMYSAMDWTPGLSFSYRDSRTTPGIQIADLVAYVRRRRLKTGRCMAGSAVVNELRL